MSSSDAVTQFGGNARVPFPVYWTAKNINATAGSRTAIASNIAVGAIVVEDPYQHDGADGSGGAKPINVTQPQTSHLHQKKYVVVAVAPGVNDIPDSAAPTQRRGGVVYVTDQADDIEALVDGTTDVAVGDHLECTNGSWNLTKRAALTTQSTQITFAYAGTPDFAIANAVQSNTAAGFAFSNNDEFGAVLTALANLQTRAAEIESRLSAGICAIALAARTANSAALTRVRFNGNRIC